MVLAVFVVNAVIGAVLYLDVVRSGRSGWWLLAFWLFGPLAMAAYLLGRARAGGRPGTPG